MPEKDRIQEFVLRYSLISDEGPQRLRLSPELARVISWFNGAMTSRQVLAALRQGHTVCTEFNGYTMKKHP